MNNRDSHPKDFRVVIAGGGVAALEAMLTLRELAGSLTDVAVLAPEDDFVYRPMTVREPFAYGPAQRYPMRRLVEDAGAELIVDELEWVDPAGRIAHTRAGAELAYDALVLALGATARPRFEHALTIDDRRLEETFRGLVQDVEDGYVSSLAFLVPGRMAWPLPIYELALMTAGRAYDMDVELAVSIVTPEDGPLAIFGGIVSDAVARLLREARIEVISSSYAEVPEAGHVEISPGERRLTVDRVVALPELFGPGVRGVPLSEHGFIHIDPHGQVPGVGPVYAAGDASDFAVKFGGIAAQQADAAAESIAALAGAPVTPAPFHPVIHGILLTDKRPRYLTARITGGQGFGSEISDTPSWSPPSKIQARRLAPHLERYDREPARHA
ncbi:MAG TPA: FAD-dependent oxidoreductase [Solirubrobacteraceae bacterium]|jgi:sulfide:quinone oxidoreductase|nr:FAD-dependent oxidoreductase [Solirubrobacteraceae bacterium]